MLQAKPKAKYADFVSPRVKDGKVTLSAAENARLVAQYRGAKQPSAKVGLIEKMLSVRVKLLGSRGKTKIAQ